MTARAAPCVLSPQAVYERVGDVPNVVFPCATPCDAVAMLVGAATGRRAPAIALSTALVVAAYLLNALAPLVGLLHSVRWASPWYHYTAEDPLRHGVAANSLVLVGILVVALVFLPVVFERRDLTS